MKPALQIDSHKLQYHPSRVADFLERRTVWPLYAEISPTSACNHRCLFCNFNYLGHKNMQLPAGRMQKLARELKDSHVKAVVFAGAGEPSQHPDLFPAMRIVRELGMDAAMSTNGARLNDGQLMEMAKLLSWVRFSFNGGTPEAYGACHGVAPGDFHKALSSLRRLSEYKAQANSGVTVGAQCVLLPENRKSIEVLARLMKESGADYFSVKHFYPHRENAYQPDMSFLTENVILDLRQLADELSDAQFTMVVRGIDSLDRTRPYKECHGLPFIIYIREDGTVYACFSHQDDTRTAIGSILGDELPAIWLKQTKDAALQYINQNIDKDACQVNCRHHQINLWLHQLKNPPMHVNFI